MPLTAVRYLMVFVRGPAQGRQDVDVKERRLHGRSSRSWSICAAVTFGERRWRRSTRRPLRSSVTSGRSAAFLTNSLTAWPRVTRCRRACALATFMASSSSCSVALGLQATYTTGLMPISHSTHHIQIRMQIDARARPVATATATEASSASRLSLERASVGFHVDALQQMQDSTA
jgi:hypothetical protein